MPAVRGIRLFVVSALVASGLSVSYAPGAAVAGSRDDDVAPARVVATTPYRVPADEEPASDHSDPAWADPAVTLPPEQTVEVDVPGSGWARAGSTPLSVAAPESGVAASRVRLRALPGTRVRPPGIPDNWRITGTDSIGGTRYFDPSNPGNSVRVMQGNPNSPYPNSRVPYVRWKRNG